MALGDKKHLLSFGLLAAALGLVFLRAATGAADSTRENPRLAVGYKRGPWWRARISNVVVYPAHILIRFDGSAAHDRDIHVPGDSPHRTPEQALQLALKIRSLLGTNAHSFAELAREYSEDLTTAKHGGALGVLYVPQLPSVFVDAIGRLKVNEISRPVRTNLGYHLIQRLAIPGEEKISSSEIVISYRAVEATARPGAKISRTRAAAEKRARALLHEARTHPETFGTLARTYSDAPNAIQDGDMGEWSNFEMGNPVALELLQRMSPGEVSDLLDDGVYGWRILQRTVRQREELSASVFMVGFGPEGKPDWADPSITRSREDAQVEAETVLAELRASGGRAEAFEQVRARHCDYGLCRLRPYRYPAGRSPWAGLDPQLLKVAIGQVTTGLVETSTGFIIARREDPSTLPPRILAPDTQLPEPPRVSLESASYEQLIFYLERFASVAQARLKLSESEFRALNEVLAALRRGFSDADASQRFPIVRDGREKLKERIGSERIEQLETLNQVLNDEIQGVP